MVITRRAQARHAAKRYVGPKNKTEMKTNRIWFHAWIAPLVWLPLAVLSAFYPGDKYFSFYFATIPGAWVQEIFNVGFGLFATITQIGAALLAVFALGMLMDFVQVKRNIYFYFVTIGCVAGLFAANHKIKLDDLFLFLCWVIYLTGIIAVLIALIRKATRWSNQAL